MNSLQKRSLTLMAQLRTQQETTLLPSTLSVPKMRSESKLHSPKPILFKVNRPDLNYVLCLEHIPDVLNTEWLTEVLYEEDPQSKDTVGENSMKGKPHKDFY